MVCFGKCKQACEGVLVGGAAERAHRDQVTGQPFVSAKSFGAYLLVRSGEPLRTASAHV